MLLESKINKKVLIFENKCRIEYYFYIKLPKSKQIKLKCSYLRPFYLIIHNAWNLKIKKMFENFVVKSWCLKFYYERFLLGRKRIFKICPLKCLHSLAFQKAWQANLIRIAFWKALEIVYLLIQIILINFPLFKQGIIYNSYLIDLSVKIWANSNILL